MSSDLILFFEEEAIMARTVGFFHSGSQGTFQRNFQSFADDMNKTARQKDLNVLPRFGADERSKSSDTHLAEMVAAKPEVLVAAGGPQAALAAKKATAGTSIPVVFTSVSDPVKLGLVADLRRPGGNMTGIYGLTSELDIARLQLLDELLSKTAAKVGVLVNPTRPNHEEQFDALKAEAGRLNLRLERADVTSLEGIETAIKNFKNTTDGLLVTADALFNNFRNDVVKFADGMKAVYQWREFAEAGGYMSFGPSITEAYRQVGELSARILNGESPAAIPCLMPTKFELVINMNVAAAGGFKVPASLLTRAELIQPAR
jgi:putative ABC transport system substrate-binding protein